jgi:Na+(H+)/acetate symporter ActP
MAAGFGLAVSVVVVLVKELIVTVKEEDVEPAKAALPEYTASMWSVPAGKAGVVPVATPEESTMVLPK